MRPGIGKGIAGSPLETEWLRGRGGLRLTRVEARRVEQGCPNTRTLLSQWSGTSVPPRPPSLWSGASGVTPGRAPGSRPASTAPRHRGVRVVKAHHRGAVFGRIGGFSRHRGAPGTIWHHRSVPARVLAQLAPQPSPHMSTGGHSGMPTRALAWVLNGRRQETHATGACGMGSGVSRAGKPCWRGFRHGRAVGRADGPRLLPPHVAPKVSDRSDSGPRPPAAP